MLITGPEYDIREEMESSRTENRLVILTPLKKLQSESDFEVICATQGDDTEDRPRMRLSVHSSENFNPNTKNIAHLKAGAVVALIREIARWATLCRIICPVQQNTLRRSAAVLAFPPSTRQLTVLLVDVVLRREAAQARRRRAPY
jgi:hypothetical protein